MIQIITYDVNKYKEYSDKLYTISKLGEIQALDDFEVCIIDLCNKELWKYVGGNTTCINAYKDLLTFGLRLQRFNQIRNCFFLNLNFFNS